jgi:branched-subunit amino acid transport protein
MDQQSITLTILGMALVTYVPRLLPLLLLRKTGDARAELPSFVASWLRHVPSAVLSAMLLPALVASDGQPSIGPGNLFIWAALPTALVAWKANSLFGAVVTGVACVAVGRLLTG